MAICGLPERGDDSIFGLYFTSQRSIQLHQRGVMGPQHPASTWQSIVTKMELLLPAGKRIRHLCETRKHYSQAGLAEAASCSPGTIMRVEKGLATNQGTLERVARALNVSLTDITRSKDWTRRLLSNPQMVAILDRIRTSEMETVTAGRPGRRALPMDERGQGVLALLMS